MPLPTKPASGADWNTYGAALDAIARRVEGAGLAASAYIDVTTPATAQPHGPSGRWALDFSDEFNGTALDTTKWLKTYEGETKNNAVCRTANNVVSGGMLRQVVSSATEGAQIATNSGDSVVGQGYLFNVGSYIEFRCYFPGDPTSGAYNWPAVWTSGASWPTNGEHDIAEVLGAAVTVNYHYGTVAGTDNKKNLQQPAGTWVAGWHTFGVYRRATSADYYFDGALVRSVTTADQGGGQTILISNGITGTAVTGAAGTFLVDYVRVWTRDYQPSFVPVLDQFSSGPITGRWTLQGYKGSVAVDANQRMVLTTPAGASGSIAVVMSGAEPVAGCDLYVEVSLATTDTQYHKVGVRCDHLNNAVGDTPFNGYFVELQPGSSQWLLRKTVDGTTTTLATVTGYTFSTTVATKIHLQVSGTQVRARLWQVGASEPSTWPGLATDSSIALGRVFVSAQNAGGSAPVSVSLAIDNVYVAAA